MVMVRGKDRNLAGPRRNAAIKAIGSVNQAEGGRYGVNNESMIQEAKKATQKSLSKANETKLNKTETSGTGTPVTIYPEKSIVGQTFN